MRRAPIECNLSGTSTGTYTDSHALYANIHHPFAPPYVTQNTEEVASTNPLTYHWQTSNSVRNQWVFNSDAWTSSVVYSAEVINVLQMIALGRFQPSFSTFNPTSWDNNTFWRMGPLGACYKVWAEVGAEAVTENLATGWVQSYNAGQIGETTVNLPHGYSTVYFPVIKAQIGQSYAASTQFSVAWRNGSQVCNFGYGDMSEFEDSRYISRIYNYPNGAGSNPIYSDISPAQAIYSAMIFPVVCYASTARQVTVRLSRNYAGPRLAFGRPVVLNQACSWFTTQ
jgi:hypothetical protein